MIYYKFTDREVEFHRDMALQHWQRQLRRLMSLTRSYQDINDEAERRGLNAVKKNTPSS